MRQPSNGLHGGRLFVLLGLIIGALFLTACGSDDDSSTSASTGSSGASSTTAEAPAEGEGGAPAWCGDEEIKLGIQDGGGLNAWSAASLEQVKLEAAKCPNIADQVIVNAGFDPQKATSGIQSMISQGVNALVIIPDAGVCAELPTMRQATQRGVSVATYAADGCGEVGKDYVSYSDWDTVNNGRVLTEWLVEQMGGKGNLLMLGGPPGNPVDVGHVKGMMEVLADHPDIKVLDNVSEESWPATNWDPAEAQKVMSSLLAKYPQVDGVFDGYGLSVQGEIKAFEDAGRKVPPIATSQLNANSCTWEERKGTDEAFEMATVSNRNWTGRLAVRHAVAAANDIEWDEPQIIKLPLLEDSTNPDMEPKCYKGEGPEYDPSNSMSDEELQELLEAGA